MPVVLQLCATCTQLELCNTCLRQRNNWYTAQPLVPLEYLSLAQARSFMTCSSVCASLSASGCLFLSDPLLHFWSGHRCRIYVISYQVNDTRNLSTNPRFLSSHVPLPPCLLTKTLTNMSQTAAVIPEGRGVPQTRENWNRRTNVSTCLNCLYHIISYVLWLYECIETERRKVRIGLRTMELRTYAVRTLERIRTRNLQKALHFGREYKDRLVLIFM